MPDDAWQPLAERSREALRLLGYDVAVLCMPGEPEPCGGSFAQHTAAHMAAIKAVTDHHLAHLGPGVVAPIFGVTYDSVAAELACVRPRGAGQTEGAPGAPA